MEYRKLGNSGLKISELSFGSWVTFNKQIDTSLAEKMFGTCLDAGINFFDNAEGYERGMSEIVMGDALKKLQRPRPKPRAQKKLNKPKKSRRYQKARQEKNLASKL